MVLGLLFSFTLFCSLLFNSLPFLQVFAQWLELILVWWFCYCVLIWEVILLLVTGSLYKFFVLLDLTRNSWVLCLLFIGTGRNSEKNRGSIEMEQILGTNGFPMDGALVVLGYIIHNIIGQTACCTKVCSEVLQQPQQPPKCQESWPSLSVAFFSSLDFCFGALSKSSWWNFFSNYLSNLFVAFIQHVVTTNLKSLSSWIKKKR